MPSFGAHAPLSYYEVPAEDREKRCHLGTDDCVIDDEFFFVRGCLEIPVIGEVEPFSWGVWVSLSEASYLECSTDEVAEALERIRVENFDATVSVEASDSVYYEPIGKAIYGAHRAGFSGEQFCILVDGKPLEGGPQSHAASGQKPTLVLLCGCPRIT